MHAMPSVDTLPAAHDERSTVDDVPLVGHE